MKIKTYVINLPESIERREYILEETAKYPFMDVELIEAVNGKILTKEERLLLFDTQAFTWRYSRLPALGEIGCTLSHRICYKSLLASDESVALILEDDVSFICPDDVKEVIYESVRLLEKGDTDIALFIPKVCYYSKPQKLTEAYTVYPVYAAYETCAYLINRRGAERLLRKSRPSIVADDFEYMRKQGIKIKSVIPHIVEGLSSIKKMDTVIGGERWSEFMKYSLLVRIWRGLLYRITFQYERLALKKGWLVNRCYFERR